ncbi:hypothetical protein [Streptomyces sp. 3N207]|uniref:hypothetical protein n=1 Tax=Streptomyces sp. 3N207 TaxID=3457417 RepID=UPI003FD4E586
MSRRVAAVVLYGPVTKFPPSTPHHCECALWPPGVALYLRLSAEAEPELLLPEPRHYAVACDCRVALAVLDRGLLDVPLRKGGRWPEPAGHLSAGMVQGVVTRTRVTRLSLADERQQAQDWLADHHAFVSITHKPASAQVCA